MTAACLMLSFSFPHFYLFFSLSIFQNIGNIFWWLFWVCKAHKRVTIDYVSKVSKKNSKQKKRKKKMFPFSFLLYLRLKVHNGQFCNLPMISWMNMARLSTLSSVKCWHSLKRLRCQQLPVFALPGASGKSRVSTRIWRARVICKWRADSCTRFTRT